MGGWGGVTSGGCLRGGLQSCSRWIELPDSVEHIADKLESFCRTLISDHTSSANAGLTLRGKAEASLLPGADVRGVRL